LYKLMDVEEQINSYVSDVVRSHVPTMLLDECYEKKDSVSNAILDLLGSHMKAYGFQVHKANVTDLKPKADVMAALNEINKQKRLKEAAIMEAEAEKVKVVTAAEASAQAHELAGQGIARQRSAIIEGLKESVVSGSEQPLNSGQVLELLLITQYFETLKDIGANKKTYVNFIPHGSGVRDIASQIRDGFLQGSAAQEAVPQMRMDFKPPASKTAALHQKERQKQEAAGFGKKTPQKAQTQARAEAREWTVMCPPNASPGSVAQMQLPDGRIVKVIVPHGVQPGQTFQIRV